MTLRAAHSRATPFKILSETNGPTATLIYIFALNISCAGHTWWDADFAEYIYIEEPLRYFDAIWRGDDGYGEWKTSPWSFYLKINTTMKLWWRSFRFRHDIRSFSGFWNKRWMPFRRARSQALCREEISPLALIRHYAEPANAACRYSRRRRVYRYRTHANAHEMRKYISIIIRQIPGHLVRLRHRNFHDAIKSRPPAYTMIMRRVGGISLLLVCALIKMRGASRAAAVLNGNHQCRYAMLYLLFFI